MTAPGGTVPLAAPVEAQEPAAVRSMDARLARVHLRTGALSLARAELEAMACDGTLDREGLAEVAEARWRTGDLVSAGRAARAHLDKGGHEPIAYVVAAEALAAAGARPQAREVADRLVVGLGFDAAALDKLFAGEPHADIWPAIVAPAPAPPPAVEGASDRLAARPRGTPEPAPDVAAGVEAALAAGDRGRATALLGLILREERGLAPLVLSLAERALAGSSPAEAAALHLVRGDAFRLLGRELEASAAFHASRLAVQGQSPLEEAT